MIQNLTQVQNSDKNTEIKYPKGDKLFAGCTNGWLVEFSMIEEITYYFGKILENEFSSMSKTPDNKS